MCEGDYNGRETKQHGWKEAASCYVEEQISKFEGTPYQ